MFIRDSVAQNVREDGRKRTDTRSIEIKLARFRQSRLRSDWTGARNEADFDDEGEGEGVDVKIASLRAIGSAKIKLGSGGEITEVMCVITARVVRENCFVDDFDGDDDFDFEDGNNRNNSIDINVETMSTRNIGRDVMINQQNVAFSEIDKYCGELKRELEFAYANMDDERRGAGLRRSLEIGRQEREQKEGSGNDNKNSKMTTTTTKDRGNKRFRWKLRMDFLVFSDVGNVLDALAIAGKCALFDAMLPNVRVKKKGDEEEIELVSDDDDEDDDDDDDNNNDLGNGRDSRGNNTSLDISDVPLIATATYFGKARGETVENNPPDDLFLPTIAIDCVTSEEKSGDFALAVSTTQDGAVTSIQRVRTSSGACAAVESDVSDDVVEFARVSGVRLHEEINKYLSTIVRDDSDDDDDDDDGDSEDVEMT